jgi:succinate-semialdehyde dehydrogenase / glutarate-semialdehyde dehydrogenase
MPIATINPATGQTEQVFEPHSPAEVERRVALAAQAAGKLRKTSYGQRAEWMRSTAALLTDEIDAAAATMTREMGKTIAAARAEVEKCAKVMAFYADHAEEFLADEPLAQPGKVNASQAFTRYQPLGVVLAVMPWNYPMWQVMRFAAPALMAANAGLLKHASNVPQTALYLDSLFRRGGFPAGAFQALLVGSDPVAELIADRRVKAITLTGSEPAGRSVASLAGAHIKKAVLELGGSDPFIVMPSADVERAAQAAVATRTTNNGQSCIAGKRFIVHEDVYDAFTALFVERMRSLTVDDPMLEATDVGPIATSRGRDDLAALVDDAVTHGAQVLTGGRIPEGPGWYYPPTVVAGVTARMRLFGEEAFGPVASLYRVDNASAALDLANATDFGLSSSVWTTDEEEQRFFENGLDAGAVFLNGISISYPELPFGGIKTSGYGRELAAAGIREFCNLKTIWKS